MADVKIRNLDDHVLAFYRQRAQAKSISLEEELRQTLAEGQRRERQEWLERLREHQRAMREQYGVLPDSTPGIRAERDGEQEE